MAGVMAAGPSARGGTESGVVSSCFALLVLNLLDGLFTLAFLQAGVAEEANPLMRMAYEHSPVAFMGIKLGLVNAGAALLWVNRETPAARTALTIGVFMYAAIVAYHCSFLLSVALH